MQLIFRQVLWIGASATVLSVILSRVLLGREGFDRIVMGEQGPLELATAAILFAAVVAGIGVLLRSRSVPTAQQWFTILLLLGTVYFAGEEVSWGQHLFGWDTPAAMIAINDQQETNFHNTSSWLDQKPRLLFELWVLAMALVHIWPKLSPVKWRFIFGDRWLLVPATLAILVRFPERLAFLGFPADVRYAEVQELMFAQVLLGYFLLAETSRSGHSEIVGRGPSV